MAKFLQVGQQWEHTTGKRMDIVAVDVDTHMWGKTVIAEEPDTGAFMAVEDSKEAMVNWHLINCYETR